MTFKGLPDVKRAFAHVGTMESTFYIVRDFAFHLQIVAVGDESRTINVTLFCDIYFILKFIIIQNK